MMYSFIVMYTQSLAYFINNAVLHLLGDGSSNDFASDHPPSEKRAELMRGWRRQISVNSEALLDEGLRFTHWLTGISEEVYHRMV